MQNLEFRMQNLGQELSHRAHREEITQITQRRDFLGKEIRRAEITEKIKNFTKTGEKNAD